LYLEPSKSVIIRFGFKLFTIFPAVMKKGRDIDLCLFVVLFLKVVLAFTAGSGSGHGFLEVFD